MCTIQTQVLSFIKGTIFLSHVHPILELSFTSTPASQRFVRANASYGGSFLDNLKLPTRPQETHKKCSNGHDCYFFKCHYCNLSLINVQSPKNPHKYITLTLTKIDVIFQFGSFKRTTHKVHMNNVSSKTFKKYVFGRKKLKKKQKL